MKRSICIWLGFAVVCGLTLFPPWVHVAPLPEGDPTKRWKVGHAPLFREPSSTDRWGYSMVDYPRMGTEIIVGECFVMALYLTWGRTRKGQ